MADRTVSIMSSGGDYTSLSAAIAGEDDFDTGEDNIVFQYDEEFEDTNAVTVSGFTTSADHRVIIQVDPDYMHDGTRESGARLVVDITCLDINIDYCTVRNLALSASTFGYGIILDASNINCIIENCLLYDCTDYSISVNGATSTIIVNCLIYGSDSHGMRVVNYTGINYIYNCTVLNAGGYGIYALGTASKLIKNCYAGGCDSGGYSLSNATLTTCASSDGSASTTEIELADCDFTSYSSGSEDAHIGSSSDLIGEGTDLSGDGTYPFSADFEGDTRSTWDIGADEYVSGNGYYYMRNQ